MSCLLHNHTLGTFKAWEFKPAAFSSQAIWFYGTTEDGTTSNYRLLDWVLTNQDTAVTVRVTLDVLGTAGTGPTESFSLLPGESVGCTYGAIIFIQIANETSSTLTNKIRLLGTEVPMGQRSKFAHFIGNVKAAMFGR